HYSRMKDLGHRYEHGLMLYNDERERFEPWITLDDKNTWRHPRGQTLRWRDGDTDYLAFAAPFPNVRVPARLSALADVNAYEAFGLDEARDWRWGKTIAPVDPKDEHRWLKEKA